MSFSASQVVLTGLVGVLLGMLLWDLAFDTKNCSDRAERDSVRSYYRGLHSASRLILLMLPLALLCVLGIMLTALIRSGGLNHLGALLFFLLGILVEALVAIPVERRLLRSEESPHDESQAATPSSADLVCRIRNAHIAVVVLFLLALLLSLK